MKSLDFEQLGKAGLSVFDLNSEYLARKDWSETPLGPPVGWPQSLICYINLIKAFPNPAAVFWGPHLSLVHNFAWGAAANYHNALATPAADRYEGEARFAIQSALIGRTVRTSGDLFFSCKPGRVSDTPVLICPLLDDKGFRQGALAQQLDGPASKHSLDSELLGDVEAGRELPQDQHRPQNNDFLDKSEKDQDVILSKAFPPSRPSNCADAMSRDDNVNLKQGQLFQRFAELLPTGLAILDHNAEAVFVNDQFFSLTTKKSSREFRSWPESIDPRDYERVIEEYRDAFRERRDVKVDFRCVAGDESEQRDKDHPENEEWRLFLLRPLNTNRNAGYICAVVDITELKTAELTQERSAQEARDRKQQQERFIDMVSHEIRNPLSAVLHLAEEIKEISKSMQGCRPMPDQVAEIIDAAETILVCVSHQSVLVDDILNFSKLDSAMMSLAPSVSQPKIVLAQQLRVFQTELRTHSIVFDYVLEDSLEMHGVDWVVADLSRIKQVLVNLMTNAIKFTSRKKGERRITVALGANAERPKSYPPDVVFFDEPKDDDLVVEQTQSAEWGDDPVMYLMVAFKDTGIGVSKKDQSKLFERFRQATPKTSERYGGSGLGLSISRKLCQLHGGDIGVASKEGKGSTFAFYFKARRATPPSDTNSNTSGSSTPIRQISSENVTMRPPLQGRAHSHRSQFGSNNASAKGGGSLKEKEELQDSRKTLDEPGHRKETDTSREPISPLVRDEAAAQCESTGTQSAFRPLKAPAKANENTGDASNRCGSENNKEMIEVAVNGSSSALCQKQEAQRQAPGPPRGTLLLVEDNLINQRVLQRQLQNHGFEVIIANNGQEAVDAVVRRARQSTESDGGPYSHQKDDHFSCILMDQEMPVKDGNTAAREIKGLQTRDQVGKSPILGVSANVREEQTRLMKEAGMDEVISKPFKVKDLIKKIDSLAGTF